MNSKPIIYIFVLLVFLSSCSPVPIQAATATFTYTVTPIVTPTIQLTNTPSPTNTPEVETYIWDESMSPDGLWIATIMRTIQGENYNILFTVSNGLNDQTWVVENTDFKEPEPMVGYHYPYIFKWSDNENYLYYSHLTTGGDTCAISTEPTGYDFRRLDLTNGNDVIIQDGWTIWRALSPDESRLAYVNDKDGITILDIESGEERIFSLPPTTVEYGLEKMIYQIYWSPDGKTLIYTYLLGFCDWNVYTYIFQIDLTAQQQIVLIDHDEHGYIPVEWNEQDKILLLDNEDNNWWLNPATKEITPAE